MRQRGFALLALCGLRGVAEERPQPPKAIGATSRSRPLATDPRLLAVEQNALMALDVAHRGDVLETGTIALAGDAKVLRNDEQVRKTYLGEA